MNGSHVSARLGSGHRLDIRQLSLWEKRKRNKIPGPALLALLPRPSIVVAGAGRLQSSACSWRNGQKHKLPLIRFHPSSPRWCANREKKSEMEMNIPVRSASIINSSHSCLSGAILAGGGSQLEYGSQGRRIATWMMRNWSPGRELLFTSRTWPSSRFRKAEADAQWPADLIFKLR